MRKLRDFLASFLEEEDGPTAVEYAVMLALIIVVCLAAIQFIGNSANNTFSNVGSAVNASGAAPCTCGCTRSQEMVMELQELGEQEALAAIERSLTEIRDRELQGLASEPMGAHRTRLLRVANEIGSGPCCEEECSPPRPSR